MKFKTQFDSHDRVIANSGDPEHILYSPVFDENGCMTLEESGRESIYDFIQSHADSVDIHVLLKRYANGEADVFSQTQGAYGDFTTIPTSYAELLNSVIAGENYFNSLPVEIRAKFNHSFADFMASMDKEDFAEKLHPSKPKEDLPPVPSVPPVQPIPSEGDVK